MVAPLTATSTRSFSTSSDVCQHVNVAFIVCGTMLASLGGVLFGYDMGVVAGALPQLREAFGLSSLQQEMIVSFLYIGALIGAVVGGYICDKMGRRTGIIFTDCVLLFGALLLANAPDLATVLVGRVVVGFGISVSGVADVAYLHEIAPPKYRGAMVSCNEASISLGFLLAYLSGYLLNNGGVVAGETEEKGEGWRLMFGLSGCVAFVQLIGMAYMPESPVWLESKGRRSEAAQVRLRVHGQRLTTEEIAPILSETPLLRGDAHQTWATSSEATLSSVMDHLRVHHRQTMIVLVLSVAQIFCGQINVLNFAPEMLAEAGFDPSQCARLTFYFGVVKFLATILVVGSVDVVGRRPLLLTGVFVVSASLVLVLLAFVGGESPALVFAGSIGVVAGYSASYGPLTWLLTSEMFPTRVRGRVLGLSSVVTYACSSSVSFTFLTLQNVFGTLYAPFAFYLPLTAGCWLFCLLAVPDTGGKSVEEIEVDMKKMWWWRATDDASSCKSSSYPATDSYDRSFRS